LHLSDRRIERSDFGLVKRQPEAAATVFVEGGGAVQLGCERAHQTVAERRTLLQIPALAVA
jgi:hypothetical protein